MNLHNKKETPFERIIFFSDAVVAIAITLLALELKIEIPDTQHLSFSDLISPWHQYVAFLLSFINIASFWHTHHNFFTHIKKMDEKLIYINIWWLFFIITLPFATSVLSSHFGDTAAICLYSSNIFLLSILQNIIWDYADNKPDFMDRENLTEKYQRDMRWMLNLDMLNGLIAIVASFFMPKTAFFLLFFKIPIILFIPFLFKGRRRK
ncbi:MAG: TMEM175 family protein [Spirosomataceae bacterium]